MFVLEIVCILTYMNLFALIYEYHFGMQFWNFVLSNFQAHSFLNWWIALKVLLKKKKEDKKIFK